MIEESGSFRDPAGTIFYINDRIFRKINKVGLDRINFLEKEEILKESIKRNYLIQTKILNDDEKKKLNLNLSDVILEHIKIPYISYPYEWSFNQLKTAAIFHLDFNLFLLDLGASLIDASAFNIQYIGSKPIFIDTLSIEKYVNREPCIGHKQFCENFENASSLKSKTLSKSKVSYSGRIIYEYKK